MQETFLKSIVIITLVFFIFLVVFVLFIYRHFKKEKENERAIFRAVIKAQEEERQTISSNIHDDLGALLTSARISIANMLNLENVQNAEQLKHLSDVVTQASKSAKTASNALTPNTVSKYGLKGAIIDLPNIYRFADVQIEVQYDIQSNIDSFVEISIYRIVNEIVNNSVKYSQAKNIIVILKEIENRAIEISVSDNGIGFDESKIQDTSNGINNIRNRVNLLNGKMNLETSIGKGCAYFININL